MTASETSPSEVLHAYLRALYGRARPSTFIELRWRTGVGMGRSFYPAGRIDEVQAAITAVADSTDVYLGVLPRWRRAGGRADVAGDCRVVWVDCDSAQALRVLEPVDPEPSMVVLSGTAGHAHAYWMLSRAVSPAVIERANRRLAWALGADLGATDAARILRPPGSINHKADGRTVILATLRPAPVSLGALVGGLLDPPGDRVPGRSARRQRPVRVDPLRRVAPDVYVQKLLGVTVPGHRKICCPFHDDQHPSLHVYEQADRGWYCFGCRRGGSVYDLAALLWRATPRGAEFLRLRRRLQATLGAGAGS